MSVSREELAAFADGELPHDRAAEIAALVEANPLLAEQVQSHRALKARLQRHFAPVLRSPLPKALTAQLQPANRPIDLASAREKRMQAPRFRRWGWLVAPALAASLVLALFSTQNSESYIRGDLADTLEGQLIAAQAPTAGTRILLSFRDDEGAYCRVFASAAQSGIACRERKGWRLQMSDDGLQVQPSEYRMASNQSAAVLEQAQEMARGAALSDAEEHAARERGWR